jgi:hypothetical protein
VERVSGAPLAKPKGSHDSVQLIIHGPMRLQYWLLSPGKGRKLLDRLVLSGELSCKFRDMVGQTAIRPEG